jgi:circadian clock protein KaiC
MKRKIQVIPSGIPLVDLTWGGFYRGGSYFLLGPRKSGRTILALQFAMRTVAEKETCLFFTSVRPKDLMINAASIDFDLQQLMNQNQVIIVKVTPPKNIEYAKDPDTYLSEYIRDIKTIVDQYNPKRIVFDELTPFVGFKNIDTLKEAFLITMEHIEDKGITSLYVLGEPVTPAAQKIADTLVNLTTGYITLEKENDYIGKTEPAKMNIIPNVGHVEGQFSASYYLEPYKGIEIEYQPSIHSEMIGSDMTKQKYTSLSEIELPVKNYSPTNIYSLDDFKLILNNQIAYFKSTGQPFTLVSIRLDDAAVKGRLLTLNQLQNAVRLSVEKKDRICVVGNKVIAMFTKEDKNVNSFIAKVINNLPNNNSQYVNMIIKHISMYSVKVEKDTRDADEMFEQLFAVDFSEKNGFGLS